jgi:hypothetical protein
MRVLIFNALIAIAYSARLKSKLLDIHLIIFIIVIA